MSDKEDSDTLQAVWSAVHKRCPSATVSTIMTDDGTYICIYIIYVPGTSVSPVIRTVTLFGLASKNQCT